MLLCALALFIAVVNSYQCTYVVTLTVDNFLQNLYIGDNKWTGAALGMWFSSIFNRHKVVLGTIGQAVTPSQQLEISLLLTVGF